MSTVGHRRIGPGPTRTPRVLPVALVVPVRNEAAVLDELFRALDTFSVRPAEILFIDAGSTDASRQLVDRWWGSRHWPQVRLQIVSHPGAMPGGGRNRGIRESTSEWVAFLDAGIRPEPDWLERLAQVAFASPAKHAFGQCRFDADTAFTLAICALTNGVGRKRATLPGSMFHRAVFESIGLFPEHLRAAEDLVWLGAFDRAFGPRCVCPGAVVHYTHYPGSFAAVASKWFAFERSSIRAGVGGKMRTLYLASATALIASLLYSPPLFVIVLVAYLAVRGGIDPIRRSRSPTWWRGAPLAPILAPLCAVTIDSSKLFAAIVHRARLR